MKVNIDTEKLNELEITVLEYAILLSVYLGESTNISFSNLEKKGFIKQVDGKVELRENARVLFEQKKDYFHTWLATFPIKTPSKRYLSPVDPDTIMGQKLRKKWNSLFKNNANAAQHAIKVLEAEMEWRRKTGKFEYMHNAETWLNQGDFEKYAYLVEDKQESLSKIREDYE